MALIAITAIQRMVSSPWPGKLSIALTPILALTKMADSMKREAAREMLKLFPAAYSYSRRPSP